MRALWALLFPGLILPLSGCARDEPSGVEERVQAVLVIHGGAGVLTEREMAAAGLKRADFEEKLAEALRAGHAVLKRKGGTSVEAVEAAIRVLEDSPLFNAGRGAALDEDGQAALDAAIMEGLMKGEGEGKKDPRKRAGAVAAVSHIKNPISAARAVMEMKDARHVLLVGAGAEAFALSDENRKRYQIEKVSNAYFWTDRRLKQLRSAQGDGKQQQSRFGGVEVRLGTVGAVALQGGTLAAGTSTGGLTNKMRGRVGDSPLIGAGTYADDRACGVSCTGTGEVFIRHCVAYDVIARMVYARQNVSTAVAKTIEALPDESDGGVGGLIALDRDGRVAFAMSKESVGMYRGYVTAKGDVYIAIDKEDKWKRVGGGK
jgi:beta-aspartyl-peptidase (threonine type)